MRICSLSRFHPLDALPLVILESSDEPRPFNSFNDGAYFHFGFSDVPDADNIIVVDLPAKNPDHFLLFLLQQRDQVQWWVAKRERERLAEALRSWGSLTVVGLNEDEYWLKIALQKTSKKANTRSAADFIRGLEVTNDVEFPSDTNRDLTAQNSPMLSSPSIRAVLITAAARRFKPLKAVLPHPLVIRIYKVLEKIR